MIHATLANGQVMLFDPRELVWTAKWVSDSGEYFNGEQRGPAWELTKPGAFVIEHDTKYDDPYTTTETNSKIVRVIRVPDNFKLPVARKHKQCPSS